MLLSRTSFVLMIVAIFRMLLGKVMLVELSINLKLLVEICTEHKPVHMVLGLPRKNDVKVRSFVSAISCCFWFCDRGSRMTSYTGNTDLPI